MRPLDLEFIPRKSALRADWLLLAVALIWIADLGISYHSVRQQIAQKEESLGKQGRTRGARDNESSTTSASAAELVIARETLQRLALPWENLFGALEQASSERIVLMNIQPEPRAGTAIVSGEASDFPSVLDYIAKLKNSGKLRKVHLVKHEMRSTEPQRPLSFSVLIEWS